MMLINELVEKELDKPNYLIDGSGEEGDYAVIYFSSNGVFGDNDVELFKKNIIGKNKFEFYQSRVNKASKHIYVRDIRLKWYLNGINRELNSFKKLLNFLKEEIKNRKIITVGSSAGGYASVLFGILLNAEYIFSFSGQFVLPGTNLVGLVKRSDIPIFYMLSTKVNQDVKQVSSVEGIENVYVLPLKSKVHGVAVTKDTLKRIMNSDLETLKKMYDGKNTNEKTFIIKHFGLLQFFSRMIKKNVSCFQNKYFVK